MEKHFEILKEEFLNIHKNIKEIEEINIKKVIKKLSVNDSVKADLWK